MTSPTIPVASVLSLLLGRPLDPIEQHMLFHLTPGGVAKINSDLSKGISCENTMKELLRVFAGNQQRRAMIVKSLSQASKAVLCALHRKFFSSSSSDMNDAIDVVASYTTDEVILVMERGQSAQFVHLFDTDEESSADGFDLEDLAIAHRLAHIDSDFDMLRSTAASLGGNASARFRRSHLIATTAPQNLLCGNFMPQASAMNLSATLCRRVASRAGAATTGATPRKRSVGQTNVVGESPLVSWFYDVVTEDPLQVSTVDFQAIMKSIVKPPPAAVRQTPAAAASESESDPEEVKLTTKSVRFGLMSSSFSDDDENEIVPHGYRLASSISLRSSDSTITSPSLSSIGSPTSSIKSPSLNGSAVIDGAAVPPLTLPSALVARKQASEDIKSPPASARKMKSKVMHKLSVKLNGLRAAAFLPRRRRQTIS